MTWSKQCYLTATFANKSGQKEILSLQMMSCHSIATRTIICICRQCDLHYTEKLSQPSSVSDDLKWFAMTTSIKHPEETALSKTVGWCKSLLWKNGDASLFRPRICPQDLLPRCRQVADFCLPVHISSFSVETDFVSLQGEFDSWPLKVMRAI